MNFATARKEFDLLKTAYTTGAISLEELYKKVDCELEIKAADSSLWKIDEDSGEWLVYDAAEQIWIEGQPPGLVPDDKSDENKLKVRVEVPRQSPEVPAEVYQDWAKQARSTDYRVETTNQPGVITEKSGKECQSCGRANKPGAKFCIGCGQPFQSRNNCKKCGKEHQPGNKFCTGCGQKVV